MLLPLYLYFVTSLFVSVSVVVMVVGCFDCCWFDCCCCLMLLLLLLSSSSIYFCYQYSNIYFLTLNLESVDWWGNWPGTVTQLGDRFRTFGVPQQRLVRPQQLVGGSTCPGYIISHFYWRDNIFVKPKEPSFYPDKCCHLTICFHLMEPIFYPKTVAISQLKSSILFYFMVNLWHTNTTKSTQYLSYSITMYQFQSKMIVQAHFNRNFMRNFMWCAVA